VPENLVVDTNIFVKDFVLRTAPWRLVLREANRDQVRLVIPETVVREVVNKYSEMAGMHAGRIREGMAKLRSMGIEPKIDELPSNVSKQVKTTYDARLRRSLELANARIEPIPAIPHELVIDRLLARRRPYKPNGSGYRDTLIWESVLQLAAEGAPVTFVTENWRDFAASKTDRVLHPDFVADLENRGCAADAVILVGDLASFIYPRVPAADEATEELRDHVERNDVVGASLRNAINTALEERLPYGSRAGDEYFEATGFEDATVAGLAGPLEIEDIRDGRMLEGEGLLFSVEGRTEVEFDAFLYRADWYAMDDSDDVAILDADWNDHYVWCAITRPATIQFEAAWDRASKTFSGMFISDVTIEDPAPPS
jgi:predicted nucleic acid-binding protein